MHEKIREYKQYKRMAEELQDLMDAIAGDLKAWLEAEGMEKAVVGEYKLSYTEQKRETLDKKRLEQDLGDLTEYTRTTYYKMLRVS